jgi:hypothetical protein
MNMKLQAVTGLCCAFSLVGCISVPGTHVLATPFGVAGVHSFAPRATPDNIYAQSHTLDRMTAAKSPAVADRPADGTAVNSNAQ